MYTHKLFDNSSVCLHELIHIAETHIDKIDWESKPSIDEIQSQKDRIDQVSDILDRLRIQRNKNYAHLDKKTVINPDLFSEDNPLSKYDIKKIIDLSHEILQEHYGWKNNIHGGYESSK